MSSETKGRTITEADVVNFAGLSGDFNPLHTDAEYAHATPSAHGMLGLSVATGLAYQLGFLEGTIEAFTGLKWNFCAPIYPGDTLRVQIGVSKVRAMPLTNARFVTYDVKLLNQKDEVTQKGSWTVLVRNVPGAGSAT